MRVSELLADINAGVNTSFNRDLGDCSRFDLVTVLANPTGAIAGGQIGWFLQTDPTLPISLGMNIAGGGQPLNAATQFYFYGLGMVGALGSPFNPAAIPPGRLGFYNNANSPGISVRFLVYGHRTVNP